MKGVSQLFLSEHWPEILWINSSESIWLGTKFSRMETNDEVKLREEFRPPGLPAGEDFGGREIL